MCVKFNYLLLNSYSGSEVTGQLIRTLKIPSVSALPKHSLCIKRGAPPQGDPLCGGNLLEGDGHFRFCSEKEGATMAILLTHSTRLILFSFVIHFGLEFVTRLAFFLKYLVTRDHMQTSSGSTQNLEGCWRGYLISHRKHVKRRHTEVFEQVHSRAGGVLGSQAMAPHPCFLFLSQYPHV